jgi:hypothetical protein
VTTPSDPVVPVGPVADASRDRHPSAVRAAQTVLGVAIALPFVIALVRALRTPWHPASDLSFEYLRTLDVGSRHTPLLGVYSRFRWNHPGPIQFWWSAPATHLFGPNGMVVWTILTNAAWVAGSIAAARRLAGAAFGVAISAVALFVLAAGSTSLVSNPWNPWVVPLAVLCFVLSGAAFAQTGSVRFGLLALAAGSWAVQCHIGSAPIVAVGAVIAVVWFLRARPAVDRPARAALIAGLLLLVLWGAPVLQQVRGPSGNLAALADFALHGGGEPRDTIARSLGVASRELGVTPAWLGRGESAGDVPTDPAWQLVVAPALLAALAFAARRRDPVVLRLASAAIALHVASVFAITRITGGLFPYVLRWSWVSGALSAAVLVWGLWRLATTSPATTTSATAAAPRRRVLTVTAHLLVAVVLAAALLRAGVASRDQLRGPPVPEADKSVIIAQLSDRLADAVPAGAYNARWGGADGFGSIQTGVFNELIVDGWDLRYDPSLDLAAGAFRTGDDPTLPTLLIIGVTATFAPEPSWQQVASWRSPDRARWRSPA